MLVSGSPQESKLAMMHSLRQLDEKMDEKMLRTLKVAYCMLSASLISLPAECLPHCMLSASLISLHAECLPHCMPSASLIAC